MFNARKKNRRRFDAASRVRPHGARRLSIEAMESRLLLTGNGAGGGDLDYAIWNLDSLQGNYAIISAGDQLTTAPVNAPLVTSPVGTPFDVSWVAVPGVSLNANDARTLSYQHIRSALDQGVINTQQFTALSSTWSDRFSLDVNAATSPVFALGIRPATTPAPIGNFSGSFDLGGFHLADDSAPSVPRVNSLNPIHTLQVDVKSWFDFDQDGSLAAVDFIEWRSNLDAISQAPSIPQLTLTIDLNQSGGNLLLDHPLTNLGDFNVPSPFEPIQQEVLVAAPVVDIAPLEILTSVTVSGPTNLAGQTFQPVTIIVTAIDSDNGAINKAVDSKLGESPASDAPARQVNPSTGNVVIVPVPTRRAESNDELAEAIDTLLSEDTILVVPDGQSGTHQVADATPGKAEVEQFAEGGMIAIDQIVAITSSEAAGMTNKQLAAAESTGLVGELSRVAVMELIEGEPEPAAPVTADHAVLLAASTTLDDQSIASFETVRIAAAQAGQALAMVSPLNPAYLASFASAASDAFAAAVHSELSAQLSDAARREAFSEWGDDDTGQSDADQSDADSPAPAAEHTAHHWLDAAPLVVALACERALAAKKKRNERESSRRSLKAK